MLIAMLDTRQACAETQQFMDPVQGAKIALLPTPWLKLRHTGTRTKGLALQFLKVTFCQKIVPNNQTEQEYATFTYFCKDLEFLMLEIIDFNSIG